MPKSPLIKSPLAKQPLISIDNAVDGHSKIKLNSPTE